MKSAITISNYEEFFLLYIDNELSAANRHAVEQFVQANPDLAIELEMLQQMQLQHEQLIFNEKPSLYRHEAEAINLTNYEEQFLLYVDNELNADDKQKVETFVLQHPAVQQSFTLLKQAKLEPELIVFIGKQSLYRKEENERRIFYIGWQKLVLAAAFIGLVILIWNVLPYNKTAPQNLTGNTPSAIPAAKNNPVTSYGSDNTRINNDQTADNSVSDKEAFIDKGKITALVANNTIIANPISVHNEGKSKETLKQEIIASVSRNGFETTGATTQSVSGDNASIDNADLLRNAIIAGGSSSVASKNDDVQPAVYKELDTEDEKKSLLLGSLEINKDKLRGFFRKAGSLFRNKSKTEDEKSESRPSSSNTRALE